MSCVRTLQIESQPEQRIAISFSRVDLTGYDDHIRVFDGNNKSGVRLGLELGRSPKMLIVGLPRKYMDRFPP